MIKTSDVNRRGEAEVINTRRKKIHTQKELFRKNCRALYVPEPLISAKIFK